MVFERGVFTLSLDFELVWGSRDLTARPDTLLRMARVTREEVFGALLDALGRYGAVATWATVGHLFLDRAETVDGVLHPDLVPPQHAWRAAPWFEGVPAGSEADNPEFYGRSLVERLKAAGQDIGSHSFSHPIFGDPGCSRATAETDLARCVKEASALGVTLKSFVFPRNVPGHVDLLAQHGFTCWRGPEPVWYRGKRVPKPVSRLAHIADVATVGKPPTVMPARDAHGLWVIPASTSLLPIDGVRRFIPVARRVERAVRCLDQAARDRRICHFWTHPINLASDPAAMLAGMDAVLAHAARLRDAGRIDILPMAAIAAQAEAADPL